MAFSIRLYKMTCEKNRVDKTNYLTNRTEYNGTFKSATSISTPSFILETPNGISDIQGFNYFYIYQLHRYYFITDLISISDKLTQINGRVDVLMSFRNKFMNLSAIIGRNELTFDEYIEDKEMGFKNQSQVIEYPLSDIPHYPSVINTTFNITALSSLRQFVLNVINNPDDILSVLLEKTPYEVTDDYLEPPTGADNLPIVRPSNFLAKRSSGFFALNKTEVDVLSYKVLTSSSLASFVKSLTFYPFYLDIDTTSPQNAWHPLYIGTSLIDISEGNNSDNEVDAMYKNVLTSKWLASSSSKYIITEDFTLPKYNSYLDSSPYSKYEIYIPFVGYTEINLQELSEHNLIIYYSVNFEDESSQAYLYDMTAKRMIFSSSCQLGVRIPMNTTNLQEKRIADSIAITNYFSRFLGDSINMIGQGLSENYGKVVGSAVDMAISNPIETASKLASNLPRGIIHQGTTNSSFYSPLKGRLRITKSIPVYSTSSELSAYAKIKGRPLSKIVTLSSLSGFTIVSDIHLENLDNALDGEINELYSLLTSGVIL